MDNEAYDQPEIFDGGHELSFENIAKLSPKEQLVAINERINQQMESGVSRSVTPSDVLYLFDRMPFLQIVNADAETYQEPHFNIVRAKTQWDVQDYGDAMAASPGRFLFNGTYVAAQEDDDESGGGSVNGGHGTIVNQAVLTAQEMVDMAQAASWGGVLIVDGHPLMQWAAWSHARKIGLYLEGFDSEQVDVEKHERSLEASIDALRKVAHRRR